jgi:hypothetical protein
MHMNLKQVVAAMGKGATLCMEYNKEQGKVFWLEPTRTLIRQDVGERVIELPFIATGGDTLFKDTSAQTWKVSDDQMERGRKIASVRKRHKAAGRV